MHDSEDTGNVVTTTSEEELDTFDLQPQAGNSISLSSQLMGLGETLGAKSSCVLYSRDDNGLSPGLVLTLQFPNLEALQDRIEVFFKDMNPLLPILNQSEIVPRIARTLKALGYNERTGIVCSQTGDAVFLGIILNIVAIADTEIPELRAGSARSGWNYFQQGERLAKYFTGMKRANDLDRICYYALGAIYLFRQELLRHASAYIMHAWNAATEAGLNDQSSWPRASLATNLTRQKLWWSIYTIDIHIFRRRGKPYLIRENEVSVAEFVPQLSLVSKHTAYKDTQVYEHLLGLGDTSIRDMEYYQTGINLCRLWKQIWDTMFSAKSGRQADAQDLELLDTRILYLERITPSTLKWRGADVIDQHRADSELFDRRRLLCQLVRKPRRVVPSDTLIS